VRRRNAVRQIRSSVQFSANLVAISDMRAVPCINWTATAALYKDGFSPELFKQHAPEHAWTYGFVAGAGLMPPPRGEMGERVAPVPPVDISGIDHWMDGYCRRRPHASIGDGVAALVEELGAKRRARERLRRSPVPRASHR
jgi:hypothetical protein